MERTPWRWRAGGLFLAALVWHALPAPAAGSLAVRLTVAERLGIARSGELVTVGVPLPMEAGILGTEGLAVLDAATGENVDAGFTVTERWGGAPGDTSRPIRWLLVTFRCDVPAGGSRSLWLTDLRPPEPSVAIQLDGSGAVWRVDTGPGGALFEVPSDTARLLASVRLRDGEGALGPDLLAGVGDDGPYLVDGSATAAAARAQGGCRLEVARFDPSGQTLVLALHGAYRTFAPGDPQGSTDEDLEFLTTMTFQAGSRAVLIRHTVGNHRDWVALENNADFREIQSPNHVTFDEDGIRFTLAPGASSTWAVSTGPEGPVFSGSFLDTVTVYQDNTGDENWDLWRWRRTDGNVGDDPVAEPVYGPQAYVRTGLRGCRITEGSSELFAGTDSEDAKIRGYLAAEGPSGGVAAAIRHAWRRYPKALRLTAGGALELAFLPREFRARHVLRVGEETTEEALLVFHGPGEAESARRAALGFQEPLVGVVDPDWACEISRTEPLVAATADPAFRFPPIAGVPDLQISDVTPGAYDEYLARHLQGPGEAGVSFDGLDHAVAASQMYSWMDWGDLPIDFEEEASCGAALTSVTGQYGWKYDGDWGLLAAFLRSGDPRFLDRGLAAAAHTADIDILHHGRRSGRGIHDFRDGGAFGHSQHNNDGDRNPHRNGVPGLCPQDPGTGNWNGTPTPDVAFGARGLALAWALTGQLRFREALLDLADWMEFYVRTYGVGTEDRSVANALGVLSAALEVTGETRYREAAHMVVAGDPNLAGPMPPGWFGGWYARSLGRYAALLRALGDTTLLEEVAGLAGTPQEVQFDPAAGIYRGDVDFYAGDLCRADAYAWGALLLPEGRAAALARARDAFATGLLFPFCPGCLYGHARVWQAKEWVVSLACGHVYELAAYDAAGGPRFRPAAPPVAPAGFPPGQNAPPSPEVAGPSSLTLDEGEPHTFDAAASSDPDSPQDTPRFFWDFGDGGTAAEAAPEHAWKEPGAYSVHLWVSDGESVAREDLTVTVREVNHPPAADAGPDRVVPAGTAVRFDGRGSSDPDGDELQFLWDFGDGTGAEGPVVTHAFDAGVFTTRLTVSDGVNAASDQVTVRSGEPLESSVTVDLADDGEGSRPCSDTYLWADYPDTAFGGEAELAVSRQSGPQTRALLRFDLSPVPAGSLVESASLSLQVTGLPYGTPETTRVVSRRLRTAFSETSATWLRASAAVSWQTPGGDLDEAEASQAVGPVGERLVLDVTAAVRDWVTGLPNRGLALDLDPAEDYHITWYASCDAPEIASRPVLAVRYRPPADSGEGPVITGPPEDTEVMEGEAATLSVEASGSEPLAYAWYRGTAGDTSSPVGDDAPVLVTPPLTSDGSFWVRVSNPYGSADSRTALVTVRPPDTTPPGARITAPSPGDVLAGTVAATAELVDDTALASAVLVLDGAPTGRRVSAAGTLAQVSLELDTTRVPDGTHQVAVRVWDAAGNRADSAEVSVVCSNGLAPSVGRTTVRLGDCSTCSPAGLTMLALDPENPEAPGSDEPSFELGRAGTGRWFLLRWDLSGLAPGSRVARARVVVTYTPAPDPGWPWDRMVRVMPVEDPDGLGGWDPGAVSFARRREGVPWTEDGGGLDRSVGTQILARWYGSLNWSPGVPVRDSWELPPELVQGWIDEPSSNLGLGLAGVSLEYGAAGTLAGPGNADPEQRPYLELELEAAPPAGGEPPQVDGVRVTHDGAGRTVVTWRELPGDDDVAYRIYRAPVPITASGLDLAELVGEVHGNGSALAPIRTMAEGCLLPTAVAGAPYDVQFSIEGTEPITGWTASNLPAGLVMDADGRLHGTPAAAGARQVTVVPVRDAASGQEALAFTVTLVVADSGPAEQPSSGAVTIRPNPDLDATVLLPSGSARRRWAVRQGEGELPEGTGLWVGAPEQPGMAYYAVTTVVDGQENRSTLGPGNAPEDPVEEVVGDGLPVLQSGPLAEEYAGDAREGWVWAFWPGHGRFGNRADFPGLFRVVTPVPPDPELPHPAHLTFGGYGTTYMMPPYETVPGSVVVIPEARTPLWDGFGGHALSDWFVGYLDTLGRLDARPADGTFRYYGVERTAFIVRWLTEGPGRSLYGIDPDRVVAWGGSQGGTGVLFTVLREPGLFAAAQANVPCLDWFTEDHGNLWTSGTFQYLAGRPEDGVRDADGTPVMEALDAPTALSRLAASPAASEMPRLAVLSGWNDPTLAWDADQTGFAGVVADAGLPVTFAWHDGGHWTNAPAPFLQGARRSAPTVGIARCTLVSSPVPPEDAGSYSEPVPWPVVGSVHGDPDGFENGAYPTHIAVGEVEESPDTLEFTVRAGAGEGSGTADLVPLRRRSFLPAPGTRLGWRTTGASGGVRQEGTVVVGTDGRFTLPGVAFDQSGVLVEVTVAGGGCDPDGSGTLDAADLAVLLAALRGGPAPPGSPDCVPDGVLSEADLVEVLAGIYSPHGRRRWRPAR